MSMASLSLHLGAPLACPSLPAHSLDFDRSLMSAIQKVQGVHGAQLQGQTLVPVPSPSLQSLPYGESLLSQVLVLVSCKLLVQVHSLQADQSLHFPQCPTSVFWQDTSSEHNDVRVATPALHVHVLH